MRAARSRPQAATRSSPRQRFEMPGDDAPVHITGRDINPLLAPAKPDGDDDQHDGQQSRPGHDQPQPRNGGPGPPRAAAGGAPGGNPRQIEGSGSNSGTTIVKNTRSIGVFSRR